jgi:hypothetical protein
MNPPQLNHPFFSCKLLYSVYWQLQGHFLHSHAIVVCGSPFFSNAPNKKVQLICSQNICSCLRYRNVDSTVFASQWPFYTHEARTELSSFRLLCSIHSWKYDHVTDLSHDHIAGRCCEQMGSPIAILWHCKKNWFQPLYLDSSVGGTRGV